MKTIILALFCGWLLSTPGNRLKPILGTVAVFVMTGVIDVTAIQVAVQTWATTDYPASQVFPTPYELENPLMEKAFAEAQSHGIDPLLFLALIKQESDWNPDAVSPKGAIGLTQIMPFNASSCGLTVEELYEVDNNLRCGAFFLTDALSYWNNKFPDDKTKAVQHALAEYNAGRKAVENRNALSDFPETQKYVERITNHYLQLASK